MWREWFSDEERQAWVHRLANLLLLARRRNSAAQNFDFETKKEKYFSGRDGTSPFAITTQVLHQDSWTPDVLDGRQRKLVRTLEKVWDLEPA